MNDYKSDDLTTQVGRLAQDHLYPTTPTILDLSNFGRFTPDMRDSMADLVKAFEMPRNQMAEMLAGMSEVARHIQNQVNPFREALLPLMAEDGPVAQMLSQQSTLEKLLASDPFREMRESTRFFEKMVEESQSLRKVAGLDLSGLGNLAIALGPLNHEYGSWLNDLTLRSPVELENLGSILAIPSQEMIRTYEDLGCLLGREENQLKIKVQSAELPKLEQLLHAISPGLLTPYRAVVDGMKKRGEDYQRHVAVSLRTLLDHAFLQIAPNSGIKAFLAARNETMKDEPGWGLRVEFALCSLGEPGFVRFMDERADVMKINVRIIQKSLHELEKLQSEAAFSHWVNNTLSSLQSILEARHLALARL